MQMQLRAGGSCMPATTRHRQRPRQTCCHAYPDFRRLMFLPDGAWVFEASNSDSPVYGDSFIMHTSSPQMAAPSSRRMHSLVPTRHRPTGVAVRSPPPTMQIVPLSLDDIEVSMVVLPAEESTGIVPFRQMLLESETGESSSVDPLESSSNCLAIVPKDNTMLDVVVGSALRRRDEGLQLPVDDESVYETFNTKHPRRTMKIKFKCKICNATNIKPINPHAWTSGSVFARCSRCNITHKLIDNLKLFHELAGPVFNAPLQPLNNLAGQDSNLQDNSLQDSPSAGQGDGNEQGLKIEYDVNGFPILPERLQLRLNWHAPTDFPDGTSNFN